MVGKVTFFCDFGGKIPSCFVCISGTIQCFVLISACFVTHFPTLSVEYQRHSLAWKVMMSQVVQVHGLLLAGYGRFIYRCLQTVCVKVMNIILMLFRSDKQVTKRDVTKSWIVDTELSFFSSQRLSSARAKQEKTLTNFKKTLSRFKFDENVWE